MKETSPVGNYRWTICSLLFIATTINYLDRSVISLLKPTLEQEFKWSETDYANIVIAFQLSYAIGMLSVGRLIDKIGTKLGYAISVFLWSLAAMGHGWVQSTFGFFIARAALGISEAGNLPAAVKSAAEWFPKKERALATGIFNAGTNIGVVVAPLTVPFIVEAWGWQWAFILTGSLGFFWLIFWFIMYQKPEDHPKLGNAEFDYIHSDHDDEAAAKVAGDEKVSWRKLLGYKQTWTFMIGKTLTDPIWWFYLFWLPAFLKAEYNLSGTDIVLPVALVYSLATIGSVGGGWLPMRFIKNGWTVARARKTSMLIYAAGSLPVMAAQYLGSINVWFAVLVIGFVTAAHQAWSANIFTTVSDMFPKKAIASVAGLGGMAGAFGGMAIAKIVGPLFDYYKSQGHLETGYYIMFFVCGSAYLLAWLLMHILTPKMERVNI